MNWETAIDIYTLLCIKQITNENLLYSIESSVLCGDLNGKENQKKKGYIHTHTHTHTEDFPGGSNGKESACNAGDPGSILGLGRSPG